MLAYRDDRLRATTRAAIGELRDTVSATTHAAAVAALIDAGMIEAALADERSGDGNSLDATVDAARAVTMAAARLWAGQGDTRTVIAALDALLGRDLPMQIALRVPEGFAYYGHSRLSCTRRSNRAHAPCGRARCGPAAIRSPGGYGSTRRSRRDCRRRPRAARASPWWTKGPG